MKAIYNYTKNGRKLTKEGQKVWDAFEENVKCALSVTIFEEVDSGELADIFAKEFPRLNRFDMYQYIVAMR